MKTDDEEEDNQAEESKLGIMKILLAVSVFNQLFEWQYDRKCLLLPHSSLRNSQGMDRLFKIHFTEKEQAFSSKVEAKLPREIKCCYEQITKREIYIPFNTYYLSI